MTAQLTGTTETTSSALNSATVFGATTRPLSSVPESEVSSPVRVPKPKASASVSIPSVYVVEETRRKLMSQVSDDLLAAQDEWVQAAVKRELTSKSNAHDVKQTFFANGIVKRAISAAKLAVVVASKQAQAEAKQAKLEAKAELVRSIIAANEKLEAERAEVAESLKPIVLEMLPEWVVQKVTTSVSDHLDERVAERKNLRDAIAFAKKEQREYDLVHKHRVANPGSASRRRLAKAQTPEERAKLKAELDAQRRAGRTAPVAKANKDEGKKNKNKR